MKWSSNEILDVIKMVEIENLDIRTTTLGISLRDCRGNTGEEIASKVYEKIVRHGDKLVETANKISKKYGIPIVNKRVSVTPISIIADGVSTDEFIKIAMSMDKAADTIGIDYIGGYGALVQKGETVGDRNLIESLPTALSVTKKVCSSINLASTHAGINMDAVAKMGRIIRGIAQATADRKGIGCAKFVVFANVPEDNPFIAGSFLGVGEPEIVLNVGISGPGVVKSVLEKIPDADLGHVSEMIKRTVFKITRAGELIGRAVCQELNIPFGIIDLSLAPTPAIGDSISDIIELIGVEKTGTHGTTAILAMLNDAVKKGGTMASSYVGGLSGAFIPVSEDAGMIAAAQCGALTLSKLEAMTSVCSVGLDMVAIPGDTPAETISAIIADEMAIGVINKKTTAVRIIPVPGMKPGDYVDYGGLLGAAPIMEVSRYSSEKFIRRGGRIPAPIQSLVN